MSQFKPADESASQLNPVEAHEVMRALRRGEADALVIEGPSGPDVCELKSCTVHDDDHMELIRALRAGEIDAFILPDSDGERVFTLRAVHDALRESRERFQFAIDSAGMIAWEWDLNSDEVHTSSSMPAGHGELRRDCTFPEFLGEVHPDDREQLLQMRQASLESGATSQCDFRIIADDGQVRWLTVRGRPHYDEHGAPVMLSGVCLDITDRKHTEDELAHHRDHLEEVVAQRTRELTDSHEVLRMNERMASVGTLAAGLGHDISNLLFPIRAHLDLLESRKLQPDVETHVKAIRHAIGYLGKLTQTLRMFIVDPNAQDTVESIDLPEWWDQVEPFLRNAIPRAVVLEHHFADDLRSIVMNRPSLTQAIFNLVQNAGEVLRDVPLAKIVVSAGNSEDGRLVWLTVSDNGDGMSDDVKRHCLEPFFSTKPREISTGLGLALVHGAVQRAGGSIDIDTQTGVGTTFILRIPAQQQS